MAKTIDMTKKYRTRDGREARVLATDSVVVLATGADGAETLYSVNQEGKHIANTKLDLIEVKPEISGWVNVYGTAERPEAVSILHPTKAAADSIALSRRIACIPVTFHEGDGLEPEKDC